MSTSRVFDPRSGLTFEIENYTGTVGEPIQYIFPLPKPMPSPQAVAALGNELVETNDYATRDELADLFAVWSLPDVIAVSDGEWRKRDNSKLWQFWTYSKRADDDGFDEQ